MKALRKKYLTIFKGLHKKLINQLKIEKSFYGSKKFPLNVYYRVDSHAVEWFSWQKKAVQSIIWDNFLGSFLTIFIDTKICEKNFEGWFQISNSSQTHTLSGFDFGYKDDHSAIYRHMLTVF